MFRLCSKSAAANQGTWCPNNSDAAGGGGGDGGWYLGVQHVAASNGNTKHVVAASNDYANHAPASIFSCATYLVDLRPKSSS